MELSENGYVLTPGRYVGVKAADGDGELFVEKMQRLKAKLGKQLGGVSGALAMGSRNSAFTNRRDLPE